MNKSVITALVLAVLAVGWILTGQFGSDRPNADDPVAAPSATTRKKRVRSFAVRSDENATGFSVIPLRALVYIAVPGWLKRQ